MTDNDKELIKKAHEIDYIRWWEVDELIEKADTEEAKNKLKFIRSFKYHQEEAIAGTI